MKQVDLLYSSLFLRGGKEGRGGGLGESNNVKKRKAWG